MSQVHVIQHKVLLEGLSIRFVASDMGMSRNTVRKYLTVSEPKRVQRVPRKAQVREEAERRMEKLFEQLDGRTSSKGFGHVQSAPIQQLADNVIRASSQICLVFKMQLLPLKIYCSRLLVLDCGHAGRYV